MVNLPVLKLFTRPLKLVIIMTKSFSHIEQDIALGIWCGEQGNLWFHKAENVVRYIFDGVRVQMFDSVEKLEGTIDM